MKPLPGVKLFGGRSINALNFYRDVIHGSSNYASGSFLVKTFRVFIFYLMFTGPFSHCLGQQVNFVKYTVQDGLVANPVRCIYQDKKGFIWIGTYDGLSRFDGYKFTNYTTTNGLSHNFINSLMEVDGKLLISENNGSIDVFENDSILRGRKVGSGANVIRSMNDQILITTDGDGFLEYRNGSLISPPKQRIKSPLGHFVSLNDSLFLADGVDGNLFLYKTDFTVLDTLNYPGMHFYSLFKDSKKRIWACTALGLHLVQVMSHTRPRLTFLPLPPVFNFPPLNGSQVTSMIEDQEGSFWIGTSKGLVHILPNGNFQIYNEKDGLPSARINSLFFDQENNLWIGTILGLAKWVSRNNVVFFNTEAMDFRNDVVAISSSGDGKIILSTDHGLQSFDFESKVFKNIKVPGGQYPVLIAGTSPQLIHYTDHIGRLDNEKNVVIPLQKLDTALAGIISAQKHPQGIIYVATFGGLYAINKTSVKKIIPYRITSIAIDQGGHLWAGTWAEGLYRITINNGEEGLFDVINISSGIKEKEIRGLFVDSKNNIWIGSRYGGAFRLSPKENEKFDLLHFNRQAGLMSDYVISFAETNTEDIWVGTYLGLDKLVKGSSGYRVFNFSKVVNFFAEIKRIVPVNNRWFCVANSGIAVFKDEGLHHMVPLKPVIFSSTMGVREHRITIYSPADKIRLKPIQNAARFEFGAMGYINEKQILYSYRLKGGNDTTWSKPENIHEASYASLSPGEYAFEVKTIGWNGQYGEPAAFSFYIGTPFWEQWWFITLIAVGIIVLLYAFYRYRINQLLRLQTVRNNIATDLHDDIGSSLTNISILSELSSKSISDPEKAQPFLQRISEEVQVSSQAMDDIIWSVNSRNDSLQETMARMRRYAAELFDNSEINCHLQLDENAGDKKLSMEKRRDLYLIYKEALNNIHKHAGASNVWVDVVQNHNSLSMHISDDGKGFNTTTITHRNGLKNLRSRVEKWKGKIQIGSGSGKGTQIDIQIPLKE
jgi:ligand-binding sensor domain-containing protein/two-component sensor histidine kinase